MTKRRTKKDKIIAQLRRKVRNKVSVSDSDSSPVEPPLQEQFSSQQRKVQKSDSLQHDFSSLFSYDPAFIRKDLIRTLIWASIAFSIEIGLYIFWR